jgi:L-rhamnose isomerase/sugar isomerase
MADSAAGAYERLVADLSERGVDVALVEERLADQLIETPSWAYGNFGTRFATFEDPGAAQTVSAKVAAAATANRLTAVAGAISLHIPWDAVSDYSVLREEIEALGLRVGAVNPNLFQSDGYKLGSLASPSAATRAQAIDHLHECLEIAEALGSGALSIWLADGTNYAGQDDFIARRERLVAGMSEIAKHAERKKIELLIEYKFYEPSFYATDIADWGSALLLCHEVGPVANVLVDLGHHPQGANIEQIVALLQRAGRLGGFHFNGRRYGDDDLVAGSTNPFELFLIFVELERAVSVLPRLAIDQAPNIEPKLEAIVHTILNLQEAYAKALIVDREQLAEAQAAGDVLGAHRTLTDAFATDIRPLCAAVRERNGGEPDPIAALRNQVAPVVIGNAAAEAE